MLFLPFFFLIKIWLCFCHTFSQQNSVASPKINLRKCKFFALRVFPRAALMLHFPFWTQRLQMKILLSQPNKKMYCKKKQIVVVTDYKAQNNSFSVLEAKISILCAGLKSRFQYESSSAFSTRPVLKCDVHTEIIPMKLAQNPRKLINNYNWEDASQINEFQFVFWMFSAVNKQHQERCGCDSLLECLRKAAVNHRNSHAPQREKSAMNMLK